MLAILGGGARRFSRRGALLTPTTHAASSMPPAAIVAAMAIVAPGALREAHLGGEVVQQSKLEALTRQRKASRGSSAR
jgi:hypothetical protein